MSLKEIMFCVPDEPKVQNSFGVQLTKELVREAAKKDQLDVYENEDTGAVRIMINSDDPTQAFDATL